MDVSQDFKAATVSAEGYIGKLRQKLHDFIHHHTVLEAVVEEKDKVIASLQEDWISARKKLHYFEVKFGEYELNMKQDAATSALNASSNASSYEQATDAAAPRPVGMVKSAQ